MLSGSTSRGHADKYSDIEICNLLKYNFTKKLGIFWEVLPCNEDRADLINQIKGQLNKQYEVHTYSQIALDDFFFDGLIFIKLILIFRIQNRL